MKQSCWPTHPSASNWRVGTDDEPAWVPEIRPGGPDDLPSPHGGRLYDASIDIVRLWRRLLSTPNQAVHTGLCLATLPALVRDPLGSWLPPPRKHPPQVRASWPAVGMRSTLQSQYR